MTLEDLGNIGELIGGVGVVVTLLYLAIQIRQNSALIMAQTVQSAIDATQRVLLFRAEDAHLRAIIRKARSKQPLDADETEVLVSYLQAAFMNFQARLQHHARGIFDASVNESYERILQDYLAQNYVRHWWRYAKALYGTPFREHCDRIIAELDAGAKPPVRDWRETVGVQDPQRPDVAPAVEKPAMTEPAKGG
jgi:hypothetical protein